MKLSGAGRLLRRMHGFAVPGWAKRRGC